MELAVQRFSGICLISGALVFFLGVSVPLFSGLSLRVWSAPLHEYLELISANRTAWLSTNSGILIGTMLTTIGMGALTLTLGLEGEHVYSLTGFLSFALAVVFWLVEITFRLGVTPWAAKSAELSGAPPAGYEGMKLWVGLMFFLYMVMAYLATASYGGSLLATSLVPRWLAWTSIGAGLFGVISFVAGWPTIFSIPAGVHLVPLALGIFIIR